MSLQVDPDVDTDLPGPEPRRAPSWAHVAVAVLAAMFVGGAIGYVVGDGRSPSEDSVDVGFLRDMIDHHEQAVAMSLITLRADDVDPTVRSFAEEVIIFQQREIGLMDAQLDAWGRVRGDLDRRAMLWMNMDTAVADMPGMQTDEAMRALGEATGSDVDRLFLTMMREHHIGGVHMAEYAAERAGSARVRELAARMASFQRIEVNEYTMVLQRLGLE